MEEIFYGLWLVVVFWIIIILVNVVKGFYLGGILWCMVLIIVGVIIKFYGIFLNNIKVLYLF